MCQISFHIKPVEDLSIWHDFSLKCFFEKCLMSEHKRAEAPNFSHENKATAWTNFKNFFAWLTGMKKLIFYLNDFFGSGHFFDPWHLKKWPKNDRSQKIQNTKKLLSSCPLTTQRNFWNPFILWPFFDDCFLKLWIFISFQC